MTEPLPFLWWPLQFSQGRNRVYSPRWNSPFNNGVRTGNRTSSKGDSEMRIRAALRNGLGVPAPRVQGGSRTDTGPGGPTPACGGSPLAALSCDCAEQLNSGCAHPSLFPARSFEPSTCARGTMAPGRLSRGRAGLPRAFHLLLSLLQCELLGRTTLRASTDPEIALS